jgi:hypothetical protein
MSVVAIKMNFQGSQLKMDNLEKFKVLISQLEKEYQNRPGQLIIEDEVFGPVLILYSYYSNSRVINRQLRIKILTKVQSSNSTIENNLSGPSRFHVCK